MTNDMVSIIMLSFKNRQHVEESVMSVVTQTYQNWELLFVDDASADGTIQLLMELKDQLGWKYVRKIRVSQTVVQKGSTYNRNVSLKEVRGRWIAFLDAGDTWAPEKLEKQIAFMEENGYAMSYTQYGVCGSRKVNGKWETYDHGRVVSGKEHVTHQDMLMCCWPAYLTVMYDAQKVGVVQVRCPQNNDYALWLNVTDHCDCHLLAENLATVRTKWRWLGKILLTNNAKWRYDAYRIDEDLRPLKAFLYTIRNGFYGLVKWLLYVKKTQGRVPVS